MAGLVVCAAAAAACGHGSSPAGGAGTASAALVATEPAPVVAVEVWPARWPTVVAALPPAARAAVGDRDFWALAALAAKAAGIQGLALPPAGIDPDAAVALEIYASRQSFEDSALALVRATLAGKPPVAAPMLQARLTLHAKDATALAAALRAATVSGAHVSIAATGTTVTADVTLGGAVAEPMPAATITTFDPGGASAARAIARVDHLGELGTAIGIARMSQALASADLGDLGDHKAELLARGIGESLTSYLWSDPMTSFARALLVDVPAGDTKPRLAFALSDAGKATLTAGGLERGKTLALGALRWSDAISAAAVPAVVDAAVTGAARDRTTAVATLTHQCGASCFWYLALGNGFAFARALGMTNAAAAAPFLDGVGVPRSTVESAELAWTADDLLFVAAAGAGAPPAWRYAATAPAAAADACYRRALVRLRAVLVHDEHVQATWQAAVTDLAAGAGCIKSDASLAARHRAMTDLAAALMPAPAH